MKSRVVKFILTFQLIKEFITKEYHKQIINLYLVK